MNISVIRRFWVFLRHIGRISLGCPSLFIGPFVDRALVNVWPFVRSVGLGWECRLIASVIGLPWDKGPVKQLLFLFMVEGWSAHHCVVPSMLQFHILVGAHIPGQQTSSTHTIQQKHQQEKNIEMPIGDRSKRSSTKRGKRKRERNNTPNKPSSKPYRTVVESISSSKAISNPNIHKPRVPEQQGRIQDSPSETDPKQDAYYDHAVVPAEVALLPSSDHRDSIVSSWFWSASRKKRKINQNSRLRQRDEKMGYIL